MCRGFESHTEHTNWIVCIDSEAQASKVNARMLNLGELNGQR